MKRTPLLALAAGFALGVALPGQRIPAQPLAAGASLLALSPPLAPLAFFFAGWVTAAATRVPPSRIAPEVRVLEGRVASVPERFEGDVRFLLHTADRGLVLVTAPTLPWPIALGDRLRLEARLRAPEGQRNPGGRDRAAELAARGVALEAHATSAPVRLARPSPLAWLELGRSRFAAAADAGLPPREAGLVRAIGSGDRGGVDAATTEAFVRSGLAHLLSVSGLHLAVVALGAWRLLRALLVRSDRLASRLDPRRAAVLAALPLTLLYAIGTGADVPVVRSALAAALGFGAVLCDREVDALGAVALAALAVLAVEPGALLDPSFQLSFASVAGLALGSGPLRAALGVPVDREGWRARLREALLGSACASAAATLATAPIVAFHFRRLSLLAIASNVAGVPIGSALTVAAALAAAAASIAPFATAPLLLACHGLASLLLAVNDAFAAPRWAVVGVGSPGLAGCAVCYLALLAAWRGRGWLRLAAALVAALALLGVPPLRHALAMRRGGLEAVFLGVGQGTRPPSSCPMAARCWWTAAARRAGAPTRAPVTSCPGCATQASAGSRRCSSRTRIPTTSSGWWRWRGPSPSSASSRTGAAETTSLRRRCGPSHPRRCSGAARSSRGPVSASRRSARLPAARRGRRTTPRSSCASCTARFGSSSVATWSGRAEPPC